MADAGPPTLSLVVTTYERPDALAAVLRTVLSQRDAPEEVIVADDGSGPATRAVIARAAHASSVPVRHLRQPHEGFRLTRLRNLAIAAARHPYLVFVDGDMLLAPHFIADHRRFARRGWFTQGLRLRLDAAATARQLSGASAVPHALARGLGGLRRAYAWHAPALASACRRIANALVSIKGCNQGCWRDDLVAINGFNEAIQGWGPEDKDLVARLGFHGVRRQTLVFGGLAFHLYHPPASRERRTANEREYARTLAAGRARCERGLDSHDSAARDAEIPVI